MSRFHRALDRKRWERARLAALDRDGWRCRHCGKAGRLEVDHVTPLHEDPGQDPFDLRGLQSLCVDCHHAKTRGELRDPDPRRDEWRALVARFM